MKNALLKTAVLFLSILVSPFLSGTSFSADPHPDGLDYKLGLDERFRYEYRQDYDYNESAKDNGGQFFQRIKLNAQISYYREGAEAVRFFVEGMDAQVGVHGTKAVASQRDDLDFHQGYMRFNHLAGSDFDIQLGRQELSYGADRLIAKPAWSNRMLHYDAAVLHYQREGVFGDLLYAQNVKYDDNSFNRSSDGEFLAGVYGGHKREDGSFYCEGYFLTQDITTGASDVQRHTVGPRVGGRFAQNWSWDFEAPYQFGETGSLDIEAYALSAVLTREFPDVAWKPKATLEYNQASGDKDPGDGESNTFNPLYQSTHTPYGMMDFLRWQNMREVAFGTSLSPHKKWKLTPQVNFFWLESKDDSWYNSSGSAVRTKTTGERGSELGQEISLKVNYDVNPHLKFEGGYAHFFTGEFIRDTGADDDADLVYTSVMLKY